MQSIFSTFVLLFLVFLIYSTLAVSLFNENDPAHFYNVAISMFTLFQMSTMDVSIFSSFISYANTIICCINSMPFYAIHVLDVCFIILCTWYRWSMTQIYSYIYFLALHFTYILLIGYHLLHYQFISIITV